MFPSPLLLMLQVPLDPDAGRRVKQILFTSGGHQDPVSVVRALLGDDALVQVRHQGTSVRICMY